MKLLRSIWKLFLGVLVVIGLIMVAGFGYKAFTWTRAHSEVLRILESEAMLFLVTDKVTTQVVVEFEENNVLLGSREGLLVATVSFYYGMDMDELTPESIVREGNTILITLPEPKELSFEPDLETMEFITSQSFYTKIYDMLSSNEEIEVELLKMLHEHASEFAQSEELLPTRESLVERMNNYTPMIESQFSILGVSPITVVFQ
ncbi:MAG: DUF4230 domain-containing protein [Desulfovibrio sp.]|mgnify:CR=1 FL=1|nr:MAG: DUF4230 domain-containing protein [Desulfovibrio sp.]